jgi:DNA-binding Xre family transcriptional regulator
VKLKKNAMIRLKLKEVLRDKKISQSKLSRLADVSLNTIQALYHDPFHDCLLSTLDRLAKALGVTINDLYEALPDEEPPASA